MDPPHSAPGAVSRLLADLACAPERDPRLRPRNLRPGDVVGGFELLREVGRGGFGVVFEASAGLGHHVAVKTSRRGARSRAGCESLQREVEAARLQHPNIVTVLESGSCERGPYVVLEYLSGETVADALARGPLSAPETIRVAVAVARALAHAHAHGVLHRDIKPANVFLPSSGQPKVIDFGLASVFGRAGPRGSGTSRYMSPEQRRGDAEDARTDLFALGLLIHEMATGKPLLSRGGARLPRPSAPEPVGLPPALDAIISALVERDPDRRPRAAEEVLGRLLSVGRRLDRCMHRRCRCRGPSARPGHGDREAHADQRRPATERHPHCCWATRHEGAPRPLEARGGA